MFKDETFINKIMKFEIYDGMQTFQLMLILFIVSAIAIVVIDIINEITKEKTDE